MAPHAVLAALAAAALLPAARASLFMPSIFSDGLCLQMQDSYDQRPQLFGYAQPGETVSINRTLPGGGGGAQFYSVVADASGYWIAELNCDNSGNQYELAIAGSSDPAAVKVIRNVTYCDVIFCSGQSNTVFSVKSDLQAAAYINRTYPNIRLFAIAQAAALTPQRDIPAFVGSETPCWWTQNNRNWSYSQQKCNTWQVAAPAIVDDFSAVCFFTALALSEQFPGRTFGLVYGAVDGTPMAAWSPPEANAECAAAAAAAAAPADAPSAGLGAPPRIAASDGSGAAVDPHNATVLWNAFWAPLQRFALRSWVWYQGEADSGDSRELFACKFRALIAAYRRHWRIGDFAWHFVQLAPQDSPKWPDYYNFPARLGQADALPAPGGGGSGNTTCTTGMASAVDLGDLGSPFPPSHVHPRHKVEVGRRLALSVLHTQYAYQWPQGGADLTGRTVDWRGPLPVAIVAAPPAPALRGGGATAAAAGSFLLTFDTLTGGGVALASTLSCWECCGGGRDTVQLSDAAGVVWVNTTVALAAGDNATLVVTPLGSAPGGGAFAQARYAANLWPQCAVYAVSNGVVASPFLINVTAAPAAGAARAAATAPPPSAPPGRDGRAPGWALPLAQRGEHTWTEWRGVPIAPAASGARGVVAAQTPPMGTNTWNSYHCSVSETLIRGLADAFVSLGLDAVGYKYVNMCVSPDCTTRLPHPGCE